MYVHVKKKNSRGRVQSNGVVWDVFGGEYFRCMRRRRSLILFEYKLSMTNPKSKLLPLTSFHSPPSPSHPEANPTLYTLPLCTPLLLTSPLLPFSFTHFLSFPINTSCRYLHSHFLFLFQHQTGRFLLVLLHVMSDPSITVG